MTCLVAHIGLGHWILLILSSPAVGINPHIWNCEPGWTGAFCDQNCDNATKGQFYTVAGNSTCAVAACTGLKPGQYFSGSAPVGSETCPVKSCENKPDNGTYFKNGCETVACGNAKKGEYYSGSAAPGEHACPVAPCTNAKNGEYYTGSAPTGKNVCPVANCTTVLKPGQFFSTHGGTSPTGCKIGESE